jgi:hypothetical protein
MKAGNGKLAKCGSGNVINKVFHKNNNTILGNLLLVLAETIIQNLQIIGIIFVFSERGGAI